VKETIRHLAREAHRRSLWQVLAVYLVASAAVYEVVVNLVEGLGLPHWVAPSSLVLLLLGLPLVLATACIHEEAPSPPTSQPAAPGSDQHARAAALDDRTRPTHRIVTWRRTTTAIVLGFAGLGLVTTGFMGMRALGIGPAGTLIARGQLAPLTRVLVADFAAPPPDSLLADAVAAALRIDLTQSPVLQVVDPGEIRLALRRMGRAPADRLDEAAALELAMREGIPVVLGGDVTPVGSGYQIAIRLLTPDSGRVLFSGRETAADAAGVLSALDRLSDRLRERAGESLRTIRASPPLARVTTSSMEALQLYSAAVRAIRAGTPQETRKAVRLLEEAIAIDSLFATAWRGLGIGLSNAGLDRPRQLAAFTRAVELEDRLTEEERYLARAEYYKDVLGDIERAIDAFERVLELSPDHSAAHNNVALLYAEAGDYERAARSTERAVRIDSTALSLRNLFGQLLSAGDTAGARRTLEERRALYPDNPTNSQMAALLVYHASNDRSASRDTLEALLARADPLLQPGVMYDLALLAALEGRGRKGRQLMQRSGALLAEQDRPGMVAMRTQQMAWIDLLSQGRPDLAVAGVRRALEDYQRRDVPAVQRNWLGIAMLLALAGEPAQARAVMDRWREEVPAGIRRRDVRSEALAEGAIACAEGRVEEGLELHRRATERWNGEWVSVPLLAVAYDMAGQADAALETYHRFETMSHQLQPTADALFRALAYERMAHLHEERGDIAQAVLYHQRFIELWKDADPELQPRVDAARRALARIAAERSDAR
jgi:eukaryotic-like serine/threonine-protein kinase